MMRIAMWSGPRSISTALMRSFENRPDTFVTDEPFYAHYLKKTGIDHPLKEEVMANGNMEWDRVTREITGSIPGRKDIWYQKHMAQHNLPGCDMKWIGKLQNCILIRHPREVIHSYSQKYEISSVSQLGYPQQIDLFNMLNDMGAKPLILDAGDILKNPGNILRLLCKKLSIPFYDKMLTWPAGRRESDGLWGKHWYGSVEASTRFRPYRETKEDFSSKYKSIYLACLESYQQLYSHHINKISISAGPLSL